MKGWRWFHGLCGCVVGHLAKAIIGPDFAEALPLAFVVAEDVDFELLTKPSM